MIGLGLIRNPSSARNKRSGPPPEELAALFPLHAEPDSRESLVDALCRFAREGVRVVAVDGGDGTVREVLTALPQAFPDEPPGLALIASGKTNVIAADVGSFGHGAQALRRVAAAARDGALLARPARRAVMEVRRGDAPALRGMVFGAAGYTWATDLVVARVHGRGLAQGGGVAAGIAYALAQALFGTGRATLRAGTPMSLAVDGAAPREGPRALFLATTLQRFMLGIWPFWGGAAAPIRFLDVDAPAPRLAAAAWPLLRGRPRAWMLDGYRSASAHALTLGLAAPFVLDGETFEPADGPLRLAAAGSVDFLAP